MFIIFTILNKNCRMDFIKSFNQKIRQKIIEQVQMKENIERKTGIE